MNNSFVKNEKAIIADISDDEMALSEHIEEFSQRIIFCLLSLVTFTLLCFADIKDIVKIFKLIIFYHLLQQIVSHMIF